MSDSNPSSAWARLAGEMVVPAVLLAYATHYYVGVARLPRPETNLLLIGPVYWMLLAAAVAFVAFRARDILRRGEAASGERQPIDWFKSTAFVVLTGLCIWAIPVLGFVVTTLAYTLLLLLALGVRSVPVLVLTPVLLVGVLWVGMEYYLNLRLPTGLFL